MRNIFESLIFSGGLAIFRIREAYQRQREFIMKNYNFRLETFHLFPFMFLLSTYNLGTLAF